MSWLDNPLKALWQAASKKEQLDVISYTYASADKLPGLGRWRIKWRERPGGPFIGFQPFRGGQQSAHQRVLDINDAQRAKHESRQATKNQDGPKSAETEHTVGPWFRCPACKAGKNGHGRGRQ